MKYEVKVTSITIATFNTREEAKAFLEKLKASPLGWVHPKEAFGILPIK